MSASYQENATSEMNVAPVADKGYRIIQIHPTLKCNLTCKHCYSGSAPQFKEELSLTQLKTFLREAWEEGFNAIALSGGEPFIYSGIHELLAYSKSIGYNNSVTTNGMLFKPGGKNLDALQYVDLLAISLDGEPEHHNYMRNAPKAFERMEAGLELVKDHMDAYGFIHTVTSKTFPSLLWMSDYAAHHKAKLLQLHPLESSGRGIDMMDDLGLSPDDLHRVYILAHYLKNKYDGQILVEIDVIHRDILEKNPAVAYAHTKTNGAKITDHLREIIVDEKGALLPISHGFSKFFQIGNLNDGLSFHAQSQAFVTDTLPALQQMFDRTYNEIMENEHLELVNWAEIAVTNSHFPV